VLAQPIHFLASPRETDLLDVAGRWLRYLRDEVSIGPHGLVRLACSDWNDNLYDLLDHLPYGQVFRRGESGLNTAMAIVALGRLAQGLERADLRCRRADRDELAAACRSCRQELLSALLAALGGPSFLARAWVGEEAIGEGELFLEPQPWLLLIPELADRHAGIWQAIRQRVYDDEPRGARQREIPGVREDGGIWFALNGPLVEALSEAFPDEADEALEKLTCRRHAATYPDRWIGMYSCGDSINSHLHAAAPGRVASYLHPMPVFCAHAHAWPLHGWLRRRRTGLPVAGP
jgi:cellobiose phosphorylase